MAVFSGVNPSQQHLIKKNVMYEHARAHGNEVSVHLLFLHKHTHTHQ